MNRTLLMLGAVLLMACRTGPTNGPSIYSNLMVARQMGGVCVEHFREPETPSKYEEFVVKAKREYPDEIVPYCPRDGVVAVCEIRDDPAFAARIRSEGIEPPAWFTLEEGIRLQYHYKRDYPEDTFAMSAAKALQACKAHWFFEGIRLVRLVPVPAR
mgnify:FL=1